MRRGCGWRPPCPVLPLSVVQNPRTSGDGKSGTVPCRLRGGPMDIPTTAPQVVVRGEAMLVVDPEIAELGVTVTGRARDRQSALERCRARQDEVSAVVTAA